MTQAMVAPARPARRAPSSGRLSGNPERALLRRSLLRLLSGTVAVAATAPVLARPKVSQVAAQYQDRPNGGFSCAACALFRPPASCVVVAGAISPHGWCRLFDLPD